METSESFCSQKSLEQHDMVNKAPSQNKVCKEMVKSQIISILIQASGSPGCVLPGAASKFTIIGKENTVHYNLDRIISFVLPQTALEVECFFIFLNKMRE